MAVFAVVVETGSFIDASARLGLTPSAVSKQISKLESVLCLRLLERSTRHLNVNTDGQKVYSHCKDLLESSIKILNLKDNLTTTPQGLLKISAPKFMQRTVSNIMPKFLGQYPEINVQLIFTDKNVNLIADGVDISIAVTDHPPLGQVAKKLFPVEFVLCTTQNYLLHHGPLEHPADLKIHSCISMTGRPNPEHWVFSKNGDRFSIEVSGRYCSNNTQAVLDATLSDLGIACIPRHSASLLLQHGALVTILDDWSYTGPHQGAAWIIYQPNRQASLKIRAIVDFMLTELFNILEV